MDVSSLASAMIGAQAAQAQMGLAVDLMRMDARSAASVAEMLDIASQTTASQTTASQTTASHTVAAAASSGASNVSAGVGANLDITV